MIIRHKKFLDICFHSNFLAFNTHHGRWVNMGYTKSWYLPGEKIFLTIQDPKDWEKCLEPAAKCLRYAKWAPL